MATREQMQLIRTLTRRANRRIERATEGQRKALISYAGGQKFSAAAAKLSEREAAKQIEKLNRFLESETTTRRGWEAVKSDIVSKTAETFRNRGYDLTDAEISEILIQLKNAKNQDFYRAVDLVQARKAGKRYKGTADEISKIINTKYTAQQALQKSEKARGISRKRK